MAMDKRLITKPNQAVILCGGRGSRLKPYTDNMPKPMILCDGKPFLWHIMQQLHNQGVSSFVLLTGYLSIQIEEYFGDGDTWGWNIDYSKGPLKWDTGKRLWEARNKLDDLFLLLYSDNFAQFPLEKMYSFHKKNKRPLTLMVSPKKSGNISLDKSGLVKQYNNKRCDLGLDYVEIGYMIIEKEKTLSFYENSDCSFSLILKKMASKHQINAWIQNDTYHSISDPERWEKTNKYLTSKKIILLDRDGVINKKASQGEYISKWEDFEWIEEARVTLKVLAQYGFKFIVITNQAGLSRGMIDANNLLIIHNNIRKELIEDGIEILDFYVCPHHWDEKCWCRKPNPGMLFQASQDYLFRLDKSLYIGDDPRDCQAAFNAGCKSIFIGDTAELKNLSVEQMPSSSFSNLYESIPTVLNYFDYNPSYDYN